MRDQHLTITHERLLHQLGLLLGKPVKKITVNYCEFQKSRLWGICIWGDIPESEQKPPKPSRSVSMIRSEMYPDGY